MINLFIDESGSMTCDYVNGDSNFIICLIYTKNKDLLKRSYKYFIKSHYQKLKSSDKRNKMFKDNKFCELKGAAMPISLKKEFVEFLSKEPNFELYYIITDNKYIEEKFYKNTARAFNYLLRIALETLIRKRFLPNKEEIEIQIDERNERTGAKQVLQEYLNMELQLDQKLTEEIHVKYFDSIDNQIIQIADFFANLCYSHLMSNNYTEDIKKLKKSGILKYVFTFPNTRNLLT